MEIDKVFTSDVDGVADNLFSAVKNSVSEVKAMQQRKAAENVQLVIQALKKIESDLQDKFDGVTTVIEKRVSTIKDGRDGINGRDGRDGKEGRPGKDGLPGRPGKDGMPGRDGVDGQDGVSVTDARIDFDGSLIIGLSSGREINVGEVVAPDLAERIKVITNGGGTSQSVLDTLASLQAQINALDGFLDYKGTWNASTNTPTLVSSTGTKGDYYVVSVAGSTNLNGETKWGVGDWVVFNNSTWQKIDGGSTGNFTNITASGDLTIAGDIFTNAASGVFFNGQYSFTTGIFSTSDGLEMRFYAADATDKMRLNGTGLGIGNNNPAEKLDVTGNFKLSGSATLSGGTANGVAYLNGSKVLTTGSALTFDGTNLGIGVAGSAPLSFASATGQKIRFYNALTGYGIGVENSEFRFVTDNSAVFTWGIGSYASPSEQMRLTSTGLGIGTSSPANPLNIVKDNTAFRGQLSLQTVSASNFAQLTFYDQSTLSAQIYQAYGSDKAINIVNPLAHGIAFWTTNTERARIDSSGNLIGAGTTSIIYWEGVYNNTTASAANMFVASNGSFARSTSALKYKQDIRDLENVDVDLLRPVRYKSKCENDDQTKDHLGLIADEAADAGFEELVTRGEDGEVEGFQYERLTVVLLKEIQSLRKRVAQLEGA